MLWMGIWICHHAITTTHLLAQILGVSRNYGTLLDPNCCHDTVVQETHMELSHIHSKHLQGDWQSSYALDGSMEESSCHYYLLPHLLAQIWEVSWDLCCLHCAHKWCHGAVVEALTPHEMSPTSTPNIYKVIDNLNMLWMGVWRSHHTITTKLVGPDLGSQMKMCHLSVHKWCHGRVIEALNPHGMAPTSTPNIY